jgi:hypothetical protein
MQEGRFITYISRKLRRHEENYATHYLELLAILCLMSLETLPYQMNIRTKN